MILPKRLSITLVVLATAVAALTGGCAGTACDKAEQRIDACFGGASKPNSTMQGPTEDCSGAVECQANCYDQYDCAVIKDFISGKPEGKALADCLTQCGSSG